MNKHTPEPATHQEGGKTMCHYLFTRPWFYFALTLAVASVLTTLLASTGKRRYVDALHEEGLPATWRDLEQAEAAVAPQDNGFPILVEAMRINNAYWTSKEDFADLPIEGDADMPALWEPLTPVMKRAVEDYDAAHESARAKVRAALEKPALDFDLHHALGFNILLPHLAQLRSLARMLSLHVLAAEAEHDADATFDALQLQIDYTRAISEPGYLIGEFVRIAIAGIFIESLERALNNVEFTPTQLRTLQDAINQPEFLSAMPMAKALAAELTLGLGELSGFKIGTSKTRDSPASSPADLTYDPTGAMQKWLANTLSRISGFQAFTLVAYTRAMRSAQELGKLPASKTIACDFTEEVIGTIPSVRALLINIMLPALGRGYEASARSIAQFDLARTALALLHFHGDHGTLPDTLDELVPTYIDAVPKDPFSASPLHYRANPGSFLIYSIGHDREDDNGADPAEKKNLMNYGDINFEVRW